MIDGGDDDDAHQDNYDYDQQKRPNKTTRMLAMAVVLVATF